MAHLASIAAHAEEDNRLIPLYNVLPAFVSCGQYESAVYVTTEAKGFPDDAPDWWKLAKAGNHSGLSDDGALAGKHVLHQAISLAVLAGFSTVTLRVPHPEPHRRALDSLVRPLRHKRITVTGCAPFPTE